MKDPKAFIEYSNNMQDFYKKTEENNPSRKSNLLIVFDDIIADIISNKKLNPIVTKLFIRGAKLIFSTAFITQSYFQVPKDFRLNCTHSFVMKIQNIKSFNKSHLIIFQILALKTS